MARKSQKQNIDKLIQGISIILESRCSLSEEDVKNLTEASTSLKSLKGKKGKTNKEIQRTVVKVVGLLSQFFKDDSKNRGNDASENPNTP